MTKYIKITDVGCLHDWITEGKVYKVEGEHLDCWRITCESGELHKVEKSEDYFGVKAVEVEVNTDEAYNYSGDYEVLKEDQSPLKVQYGGTHYKDKAIQPIEYILANDLNFCEGNAIKYLTRWRDKGGIEDLKKAKHYIDFLIENEEKGK